LAQYSPTCLPPLTVTDKRVPAVIPELQPWPTQTQSPPPLHPPPSWPACQEGLPWPI
jgi:hypothetical protein